MTLSNLIIEDIHTKFCNLSQLHVLDLSQNNLPGHIPHCIGDLSFSNYDLHLLFERALNRESFRVVTKGRKPKYKYSILSFINSVDLSNNKLSWEIPVELTKLQKLQTLNLSTSHLKKKIPTTIRYLTMSKTFDLSGKNFFGEIPVSMVFLTFLSHLNFSFNGLSGKIPTANQFQTLDDLSIYQGNIGLCGKPLQSDCPDSSQHAARGEKEEKESDAYETIGFFVSMSLGFVVGFWGVLGSLIIKKSWRHAYFGFAEKVGNRVVNLLFT
ncbi:receptor-like protein EIX2 [Ziziphus jujuba]|uniref:Receptor-like protein EIX2 n=1 Tax=Ziziphus jujuba TaxID=326968 RepID=A0ABM3ZS05_ZIZJJ|nr:receptor-like protein EIX2 [Ziziphus jujuba]